MALDPIPQSLPVHFFGSRPQPPTSPYPLSTKTSHSNHVTHLQLGPVNPSSSRNSLERAIHSAEHAKKKKHKKRKKERNHQERIHTLINVVFTCAPAHQLYIFETS